MRNLMFAGLLFLFCFSNSQIIRAEILTVASPDRRIAVKVAITKNVHYQVFYDGKALTKFSPLSLHLADGRILGQQDELKSHTTRSTDQVLSVKGGIRSKIRDQYNELVLSMSGNYQIIFRVFNDGVAYRYVTNFREPFVVQAEWVEYKFPDDVETHAHIINTYRSSFEKHFTSGTLTSLSPERDLISPPLMVSADEGPALLFTESDQMGYPGILYRRYSEENIYSIKADFAPYPATTEIGGIKNFNQLVASEEDFIAKMDAKSAMPWRLMIIEEEAAGLVDNTLVYQLASPSKIDDSWVKYGKVAWDWYNALNLSGVPFETGINTATYQYYIDFASRNNIEYIILDEGWSDQFDIQILNDEIDLKALIQYGKERNVGIILWAVWYPLLDDMDELFRWVRDLGAVGLKIDFFDRNDQPVMQTMEQMLATAAKYELLIDFHGCPTLAGLERTYPNLVTYESVKGNEFVKWDKEGEPPYHNVGLAFTRNVVGPMDYTPGAMRNATQKGFSPNFESPMSKSTRAHQVGMYPVYFSPLQMLCDAPTTYEKEPQVLDFIAQMPTTWDETVVLAGQYPDYLVVARKKGDNWYVGGLNNQEERSISIDFGFLDDATYQLRMISDGLNANRDAEDYQYTAVVKNDRTPVEINMKIGGGFSIILEKI